MRVADFARLKKMMSLTTSENDGEALAALRAANKIIAASGTSWQRIFDRLVTIENPIEAAVDEDAVRRVDKASVDVAFEAALAKVPPGRFRDFLLDLEAKWQRTNYLTPDELAAVENATTNFDVTPTRKAK